jgi:hypothetical protein
VGIPVTAGELLGKTKNTFPFSREEGNKGIRVLAEARRASAWSSFSAIAMITVKIIFTKLILGKRKFL